MQRLPAHLDALTAASRPGDPADLYDDPTPGTGHYAWRWNDVGFVNLNVKPGFEVEPADKPGTLRRIDPRDSTGFLEAFLLSRSKSTSRQIMVLGHYPIGLDRISDAERATFCRVLRHAQTGAGSFGGVPRLAPDWPVIAYLHGHTHDPPQQHDQDFTCPAPYDAVKIPQFNVGTPQSGSAGKHPGRIQFSLFRIGNKALDFVGVDASESDPAGPWTFINPARRAHVAAP